MSEVSVTQLATDIDTSVERLLQQFSAAGLSKSVDDMVSEDEKQTLLNHLKKQHGGGDEAEPERMTLQRKTKSTLSVQGAGGKNKSVQVEVRKSRTYVRRSSAEEEAKAAEEQAQREAEEAARKAAAHAMHDALQCFHYRKYLYRQNKMIIFVAGYEHNEN